MTISLLSGFFSHSEDNNKTNTDQAPQEGYLSRITKALTLPVIKGLDYYCGKWQSTDLRAPATTPHLLNLAKTGSETLNALATDEESDPSAVWDAAIDKIENEDQLLVLNTLVNVLAYPENDTDTDTSKRLLSCLPESAKHFLLTQRHNLSNNFLFHSSHMLFNVLSPDWQKSFLRNLPNSLKGSILSSLKSGLFENQHLKPYLSATLRAAKEARAAEEAQTPTNESTETSAAQINAAPPLTDTEITQFADELWTLASDCLHAARTQEPDPDQLMAAHTPNKQILPAEQNANMRAAIKAHLPLFERVLTQPNTADVINQICERGKLPESIATMLHRKLESSAGANTIVFDTVRSIAANLSPILSQPDREAMVDQIPDEDIARLTADMNQMLQDIDPYTELPFYREFSEQLASSIKIRPVKIVAEQITKNYFQALKNYPEFQREISVAILKLGPNASMGARINTLAQAAGLGFQKSMQLFSRDIQNPEIRDALENMKQNVTPMPKEKVINIITEELKVLNAQDGNDYIYTLTDPSTISDAIKSATIGQVHEATLTITNTNLAADNPKRTQQRKVALKVKRDALNERCQQEQQGLKIALEMARNENPDARESEQQTERLYQQAVTATIEELFSNIQNEIDFRDTEFWNSKSAKQFYEASRNGVQLKSAACLAATDNLLIQEWADGESINTKWNKLLEEAKTLDNFSERLQFAQGVNTALSLELSRWVSAYATGDREAGYYLDGDRHDGNGHYDPSSHTYTVLDFGAGIQLTAEQSNTLNQLTAAITDRDPRATLSHLLTLMPQDIVSELTQETIGSLLNQIKRHIKNPDDASRLDDIRNHLVEAGVWPKTLSIEDFSKKMDDLGLRRKLIHGKSSSRYKFLHKAKRREKAMIEVLHACGIGDGAAASFSARELDAIHKAVNNEFQTTHTGLSFTKRATHQLTDDYRELFLVKTLARLAECFVEAGLPAPGIVLQLNRGAKMIGDKIEENNRRIIALKNEASSVALSAADRQRLKRLKITDMGNVFLSALSTDALKHAAQHKLSKLIHRNKFKNLQAAPAA